MKRIVAHNVQGSTTVHKVHPVFRLDDRFCHRNLCLFFRRTVALEEIHAVHVVVSSCDLAELFVKFQRAVSRQFSLRSPVLA